MRTEFDYTFVKVIWSGGGQQIAEALGYESLSGVSSSSDTLPSLTELQSARKKICAARKKRKAPKTPKKGGEKSESHLEGMLELLRKRRGEMARWK